MTILLAVSTSTARGSVAVADGDRIVAHVGYQGDTSHAERLFAALDAALAQAGVARADLGAIACDVGPGSFTGVRVGVAACQGIAVALGLPAVGVGSLEAMAFAARSGVGGARSVLAVLDARKDEVFAALLDPTGAIAWGPDHLPRARAGELIALLERGPAEVTGEVAALLAVSWPALAPGRRGEGLDLPDAAAVATVAARRLEGAPPGAFDAALLEPLYVRAPDAVKPG